MNFLKHCIYILLIKGYETHKYPTIKLTNDPFLWIHHNLSFPFWLYFRYSNTNIGTSCVENFFFRKYYSFYFVKVLSQLYLLLFLRFLLFSSFSFLITCWKSSIYIANTQYVVFLFWESLTVQRKSKFMFSKTLYLVFWFQNRNFLAQDLV